MVQPVPGIAANRAVVDEDRSVVEKHKVGVEVGDGEVVDGGVPSAMGGHRADGVGGPGVGGEEVGRGEVAGILPAARGVEGVAGGGDDGVRLSPSTVERAQDTPDLVPHA